MNLTVVVIVALIFVAFAIGLELHFRRVKKLREKEAAAELARRTAKAEQAESRLERGLKGPLKDL